MDLGGGRGGIKANGGSDTESFAEILIGEIDSNVNGWSLSSEFKQPEEFDV